MDNYYYEESKNDNNMMGPNTLRLLEELLSGVRLDKSELRILDLGCGKALNSLYFAREKEATVFATDLWISASENYERIKKWGMEERIVPIHADANELPFANEYFDMLVCVDAYHYFGRNDGFFEEKILPLVKSGGYVLIAVPGIKQELEGDWLSLMKEWCGEDMDSFQTVSWWERLLSSSKGIKSLSVGEMKCFDRAWQDWFDSKHEYALNDKMFLDKGLSNYVNFIAIIVEKEA